MDQFSMFIISSCQKYYDFTVVEIKLLEKLNYNRKKENIYRYYTSRIFLQK